MYYHLAVPVVARTVSEHNKLEKILRCYFASMPWQFLTGGLRVLAMVKKILLNKLNSIFF